MFHNIHNRPGLTGKVTSEYVNDSWHSKCETITGNNVTLENHSNASKQILEVK
jgi:hypothetical protein